MIEKKCQTVIYTSKAANRSAAVVVVLSHLIKPRVKTYPDFPIKSDSVQFQVHPQKGNINISSGGDVSLVGVISAGTDVEPNNCSNVTISEVTKVTHLDVNGLIVGACIATVFVLGLLLFCIKKFTRKKRGISPEDTPRPVNTTQAPVARAINRESPHFRDPPGRLSKIKKIFKNCGCK